MGRWVAGGVLVGLVACSGGEGEPERLTAQALERFRAGRVEQGLALARRLDASRRRDLVLLEGTRITGRDLCGHIGDRQVRDRCRTDLQRPHLRLPSTGGTASAPTEPERIPEVCRPFRENLRDPCLRVEAEAATDPGRALELCRAIADPDSAGACFVARVERALEARQPQRAQALCEATPSGRWREDCFFRLAEQRRDLPRTERLAACGRAGRFRVFCTLHLVSHAANRAVSSLGSTSPGRAIASLLHLEEELRAEILSAPDGAAPAEVSAGILRREFRVQAWYDLVMQARPAPSLASWLAWGARALPRERRLGVRDPQGAPPAPPWLFETLATMAWARTREQAGDRPVRSWLEAWRRARAAEPEDPRALTWPGRGEEGEIPPPGKIPAVLDPGSPCSLSETEAALAAIVWGRGPGAWDSEGALFTSASRHESAAVRSTVLEVTEERLGSWGLKETEPSPDRLRWLGTWRDREPVEAIRERIGVLLRALPTGERPPLWEVSAEELCKGG